MSNNEKQLSALVNTLARQREEAANRAAENEAALFVANGVIASLTEKNAELEKKLAETGPTLCVSEG